MTPTALAAFALLAGAAADAARAPTDTSSLARELVEQLASPAFRVREEASHELVKLGHEAREALLQGLEHKDPEVADRCRRLLPAAMEWHVRVLLDRLNADPSLPLPNELPGAARWKKTVGEDSEARKIFLELMGHHRKLLTLLHRDPGKLTDEYRRFCQEVNQRLRMPANNNPTPTIARADLVLFLFLGSDPDRKKSAINQADYSSSYQFLNQPALTTALSGNDGSSKVIKKLFVAWLEQEQHPTLMRRAFQLASNAGMKEAVPVALKYVKDKGVQPSLRAQVMLFFARMSDRSLIETLEPFLDDKAVITNVRFNNEALTVEMRDVALGVCVQLAGLKPADFGFDRLRSLNVGVSSYIYYGFASDEKREEAHKKWKEWWAENKKKKK